MSNLKVHDCIWFLEYIKETFPLLHVEVRKSSQWRSNPVVLEIQASKSLGLQLLLVIVMLTYDLKYT
jgi:hypothetical protein